MRFSAGVFVAAALMAPLAALADIETTTLPWANGDTLIISVTTRLGVEVIQTLSTLTDGAGGLTTVPTTTRTTTTGKTTTAKAGATTTAQRVVGQETTAPPMKTTTYGYDDGSGDWVSATWTASVTAAPTVATAIVPEGTIQSYADYQSKVNSAVLASATATAGYVGTGVIGAAGQRASMAGMGWVGMGVGAVGAVVGMMVL